MTLTPVHGPQDLQRDIEEALRESERLLKRHPETSDFGLEGILTLLSGRQRKSWSRPEIDRVLDTMEERLMVLCGRSAVKIAELIESWRYHEGEDEECDNDEE